jgi:hypothetical protein
MNDFLNKTKFVDPIYHIHFMKFREIYENCNLAMERETVGYSKIIQMVHIILPCITVLFDNQGKYISAYPFQLYILYSLYKRKGYADIDFP